MTATLKQARHLLKVVDEKSLSGDQLARLHDSGLFTDLLEATQKGLDGVDRTVYRHILGLPVHMKDGENATIYSIVVDYDMSVEDAVKGGRYDWSNSDITTKNFPTTRTGVSTVDVELVHFNRAISTDDALTELKKQGLRPAELHELLALGRERPDLQRGFPVVALGSLWQSRFGYRFAPCLGRDGSERDLYLYWVAYDWDEISRFAAVRK